MTKEKKEAYAESMDTTEKRILVEEKKIEQTEKELLREEKVVVKTLESRQFETLMQSSNLLRDLAKTKKGIVRKIAKHKFIFTLIVSTGIILVWRGIWEVTEAMPVLSSSLVALLIGITILWLIERYTDLS